MTSKERMEKLLNDQKRRELGERLVSLLMESYIEAHKIGQEDMRERAAREAEDADRWSRISERIRAMQTE